jgi:hypothetical protein
MAVWYNVPMAVWCSLRSFGTYIYLSRFGILGHRKIWQPCSDSRRFFVCFVVLAEELIFAFDFDRSKKKRTGKYLPMARTSFVRNGFCSNVTFTMPSLNMF